MKRIGMSAEIDQPNDGILVLPWNRWRNYLICAVALANLVTGIVALVVAAGFAANVASFGEGLAAVSIGLFGLLFIWVAWCFRIGVMPVQFVADAVRRECGFRWWRWWNGRFDLTDVERLIGEPYLYNGRWNWAIRLPAGSGEARGRWIYGSGKPFESVAAAEQDCRRVITRLGEHLSLPFEIRTGP
jgi:hypothetical protein